MVRLAAFPTNVLSTILRFVELDCVLKLVTLCGNKYFTAKCTSTDGLTELVACNEACLDIFLQTFDRLPHFSRLTHLVIGSEANPSNLLLPVLPIWTENLPATLVEIRFFFDSSLNCWIRPVDPLVDDEETRYLCSWHNYTPVSMKERFPRLQVLHLDGGVCSNFEGLAWNNLMYERFVANLPVASLTSLCLPHWLNNNTREEYPPIGPATPELLENLVELHFGLGGVLPFSSLLPFYTSTPATMDDIYCPGSSTRKDQDTSTALNDHTTLLTRNLAYVQFKFHDLAAHWMLPLQNLQTLKLSSAPYDASSCLLFYLPSLLHLDVDFDAFGSDDNLPLILPPNLRTLRLIGRIYKLESTLNSAPSLTSITVELFDCRPPPGMPLTIELKRLPKNLQKLSIKANKLRISVMCALPSLTELTLSTVVNLDASLCSNTNLKALNITHCVEEDPSSLIDLSNVPLKSVALNPPNLTRVNVRCVRMTVPDLAQLPKSVTYLKSRLFLTQADVKEACKELKAYGDTQIKDALKARFFPRGEAHFLTVELEDALAQQALQSILMKEDLDTYEAPLKSFTCGGHDVCAPGVIAGPSLTSLSVLDEMFSLSTSGPLPAGLKHLSMMLESPYEHKKRKQESGDYFSFDLSNAVVFTKAILDSPNILKLPESLTSFNYPNVALVELDNEKDVRIFPPLDSLPNLTTLKLTLTDQLHCYAIPHLPDTLTDLHLDIQFEMEDYAFLEYPPTWLPRLQSLSADCLTFSLHTFKDRLASMKKLHMSFLYVTTDMFPDMASENLGIMTTFTATARLFAVYPSLPALLRCSFFTGLVFDWNEAMIEKLPRTLHTLSLDSEDVTDMCKPLSTTSLASFLPPNLTHLDLTGFRKPYFMDVALLPATLRYLGICLELVDDLAKLKAQGLETLDLFLSEADLAVHPTALDDVGLPTLTPLTSAIFATLPRSLKSLFLECSEMTNAQLNICPGALEALPPGLRFIAMNSGKLIFNQNIFEWESFPQSLMGIEAMALDDDVARQVAPRVISALPNLRYFAGSQMQNFIPPRP